MAGTLKQYGGGYVDDGIWLKRERLVERWEKGWKWYELITDMMLMEREVY